jgi:Restriction Endonuclease associating with ARP
MADTGSQPAEGIGRRARRALGEALEQVRPGAARDEQGYAARLEDNLLPGIARSEIEEAFGAGAGQELEGKMRAPWSSSALAVNSFAPWTRDQALLTLAGISAFTETLAFEAQCPNGVSRIPPHLDVLLERGDEIVGVESKCTEYLTPKTAKVADAYLALADKGDERAGSRWFGALAELANFRLLDAYQLVKHFLGLSHTYKSRSLTLVYLYWEPSNADSVPIFARHGDELAHFGELVADDPSCRFQALSYREHWRELDGLAEKPAWLDAHVAELRGRYEVAV